jgi:hypothetical protein
VINFEQTSRSLNFVAMKNAPETRMLPTQNVSAQRA